jgi:hypothetical protein
MKNPDPTPPSAAEGWQNTRPLPGLADIHWDLDAKWFVSAAITGAIAGGEPVRSWGRSGDFVPGSSESALIEALTGLGFRLVYTATHSGLDHRDHAFATQKGLVLLSAAGTRSADVRLATNDAAVHNALLALVSEAVSDSASERGSVSALVQTPLGYKIHDVGVVGVSLERGNYAPSVLADFDHVVEDFSTKSPCGRLVVLSGEPGSGKSFLVRGLIAAVAEGSQCVLVPPHVVSGLADPALLPALLSAREENEGPIVLVCEDGDDCLVRRGSDNMSSVQAVLNLGDGLIGSMLDIRLLVTTNAKRLEMDPAVEREGRLCRRIDVGRLAPVQANEVLRRLVPGAADEIAEPTTLARIYRRGRERGWKPT